MGPLKFFVSIAAVIFPDWPGLIVLSNEATVHPQDGRASEITRSDVPSFLTEKTASIFSPLATTPASLVIGSIEIFEVETVAGLPVVAAGFASFAASFAASFPSAAKEGMARRAARESAI